MVFQMTEGPTLALMKLSVILLYRSIFPVPRFRKISKFLIVIICLWTLFAIIMNSLTCGTQFYANYTPDADKVNRYCKNEEYIYGGYLVSDILTDLLILVQPIPMVSGQSL